MVRALRYRGWGRACPRAGAEEPREGREEGPGLGSAGAAATPGGFWASMPGTGCHELMDL